jgi:hypothetical protein
MNNDMNDRDHSLQDEFDRYFRGDGSLPDTENDPDAAAYQMVFEALHEEPEGELPDDFAEQVADRMGVGTEPAIAWSDIVLLFLAVAALGATLVMMPSVSTVLDKTVWAILRSVQDLSTYVRLDVVGAVGVVLVLTVGVDSLLKRWPRLRPAPTTS